MNSKKLVAQFKKAGMKVTVVKQQKCDIPFDGDGKSFPSMPKGLKLKVSNKAAKQLGLDSKE